MPVEDRNASIEAGRMICVDVDFVRITPVGSKDVVIREVKPWLTETRSKAERGEFNPHHYDHFSYAYKAFLEGQDIPPTGTPIKGWSLLSPAEQENIISANVKTVEDLATANVETQRHIGMGSARWMELAQTWLKTAQNVGVTAAENEKLKVAMKEQQRQIDSLNMKLGQLVAELEKRDELANNSPERV
jgi:hypothetical protein